MWKPRTPEDRLLALYLESNPGLLFLEVEVGQGDENCGPRRLDGLLVPGGESRVRAQGSYSRADAVQGQHVHVLEAKRKLNRTVIGQVQVGVALFRRDFSPTSAQGVAVCAFGNPDLEWYCREQGIQTALYPVDLPKGAARVLRDGRLDRRKPPDPGRRKAFMRGWDALRVRPCCEDSCQYGQSVRLDLRRHAREIQGGDLGEVCGESWEMKLGGPAPVPVYALRPWWVRAQSI
ncbi:hypothetical protein [Desulfonatronum sp. SC1]|uniref:hypothetical protein n=1 Tax=Desulfonatronum sp. SC1 TaxID=2109626 RepID=UPI000D3231CB|nr:hypothetical protein [Desulfonatronum sp. SC1]PTN33603.1 hypothetical protein C6366_14285 [Desulfonatronum sp. SC1]